MSSLAAARADNFYIDPLRFDHTKRGRDGANALANSHPLGERAKRLKSEGILVIRFELPYDSWCLGCSAPIARGVRYNAEKKQVGAYFTTPVYEFTMGCIFCPQKFVIRTDPKNADYEFVSGIRKKEKSFDAADVGLGALVGPTREQEAAAFKGDPLYKIERAGDDKRRAETANERLAALAAMQAEKWEDDYASNLGLRAAARVGRKEAAAALAEGAAIGLHGFPLLPATAEDNETAALIMGASRVQRLDAGGCGSGSGAAAASALSAGSRATHARPNLATHIFSAAALRDGAAWDANRSSGHPYAPIRFVPATGLVPSPSASTAGRLIAAGATQAQQHGDQVERARGDSAAAGLAAEASHPRTSMLSIADARERTSADAASLLSPDASDVASAAGGAMCVSGPGSSVAASVALSTGGGAAKRRRIEESAVHKAVCSSGLNPALMRMPADMAAEARAWGGGSRGPGAAAALPLRVTRAESSAPAVIAADVSAAHTLGVTLCGARSAAASEHAGGGVPASHGRATDACLLPAKRSRSDAADEARSSSSSVVHPARASAAPFGHRSVPASGVALADARGAALRAAARSARCGAGSHATSLLTDLSFGPIGKPPSLPASGTLRIAVRPGGSAR
jgi:coiled-coil domain-containing protein 130